MITLTAAAVGVDRISLSWTDDYPAGPGYVLERAPSTAGPWTAVTTLLGVARSYLDIGLAPSTSYAYRLSRAPEVATATATTPVIIPPPATGLTLVGWRMDVGILHDVRVVSGLLYAASKEFGLVVLDLQGTLRGVSDTLLPGWRVA